MRTDTLCKCILAGLVAYFAVEFVAHAEIAYDDSRDPQVQLHLAGGNGKTSLLGAGSIFIAESSVQLLGELKDDESLLRSFLPGGSNSQLAVQEAFTLVGPLPDTFTGMVSFPGFGGFKESSGLDLYNPPLIGGQPLEHWENIQSNVWDARDNPDGTAMDFSAKIGVIPEPAALALGLICGLLLLVVRNRIKRS